MILKLTAYEWRKLFASSFLKLLLVLLLVANFVLCADYASKDTYVPPKRQEFLEAIFSLYHSDPEQFWIEHQRALEQEEVGEISTSPYGNDSHYASGNFEDVLEVIQADRNYHLQLDEIISQSQNMIPTYLLMGIDEDDYRVRYQKKVIEIYTSLNATITLGEDRAVGWEQYFAYEGEYYPAFIVMLAVCVMLALNDRRIGFYAIAGTCRHGRKTTVIAKFIATMGASAGIALLFSGVTLLSVGLSVGLSSPSVPIQTLASMRLCPFEASIGEAVLLALSLKLLGALLFAAIIFATSMLLKNMLLSYVAGAGVTIVPLFLQDLEVVNVGQWKYLNSLSIYSFGDFISRYRSVNLLSFPISLECVLIVFVPILMVVSLAVSCAVCHSRGVPFSALSRRIGARLEAFKHNRSKKSSGRSLSLMAHELYKCRALYAVLAVLLLLSVYQTWDYYGRYSESSAERNYKEYLSEVAGPYTEEKYQTLLTEEKECKDIISQFDGMEEKYYKGEISESEYNKYLKKYTVASGKINGLSLLMPSALHLKKQADQGIVGSFVYETGYNWYSTRGVEWLLALFIALFSCHFYLVENESFASGSAILHLVHTAPRGRISLLCRKLGVCLGTITFAWCAFSAIDILFLSATMELPAMAEPLVSLRIYEGAPGYLTIAAYTAVAKLTSLIGVWILSLVCFFIAYLAKKPIYAYAIVTVLLVVPHFAASAGIGVASRVDLTMLQNTDALFRYSLAEHQSPVWFVVFLAAAALLAIVMAVICTCRIRKGGKA